MSQNQSFYWKLAARGRDICLSCPYDDGCVFEIRGVEKCELIQASPQVWGRNENNNDNSQTKHEVFPRYPNHTITIANP